MSQITLNRLPAKTWYRLKVNDSSLELPAALTDPSLSVDAPEGIAVSREGEAFSVRSAMGGEYEQYLSQAPALFLSAREHQAQPAVLHLTLNEGENTGLRLYLEARDDAVLRVVLVLHSKGRTSGGHCALRTVVRAGANAGVALYVVNLLGDQAVLTDDVSAIEGENAAFSLRRLDLGGTNVHTAACAELAGRKSRFESGVVYQVRENGLLDMNWLARHTGRKTRSHIQVSGVLSDQAKKCFRGTIDFVRGCAGAKGAETESVLLMGQAQVNQTVPLILCEEEDVDGSHGASIGRLDDKMLFYLASRGISEEKARRLIARSRIDLMKALIPDEKVRDEVDAYLAEEEEAP